MKFGDLPSNVELPYREIFVNGTPGWVYGNGGGGDAYLWNFVMPWTGRVTVEAHMCWSWSGFQHVWNWFSSGAQGLSFGPQAQSLHEWTYNHVTHTVVGAWDSVAAGVDLSIWMHTVVGGGGPNITCDSWSLNIRALRL